MKIKGIKIHENGKYDINLTNKPRLVRKFPAPGKY